MGSAGACICHGVRPVCTVHGVPGGAKSPWGSPSGGFCKGFQVGRILQGVPGPVDSVWGSPPGGFCMRFAGYARRGCPVWPGPLSGMPGGAGGVFAGMGGNLERAGFITIPSRAGQDSGPRAGAWAGAGEGRWGACWTVPPFRGSGQGARIARHFRRAKRGRDCPPLPGSKARGAVEAGDR